MGHMAILAIAPLLLPARNSTSHVSPHLGRVVEFSSGIDLSGSSILVCRHSARSLPATGDADALTNRHKEALRKELLQSTKLHMEANYHM